MDVNTCLWSELEQSNDQVKVTAKNINAKFVACKLWVKRAGTFGVALHCYQFYFTFC